MTGSPTVGLLYPGEMGASLGRLLTAAGLPVVTTVAGRSGQTRQRAREAGIEVLPALIDVVRQSSLVFSLVETSASADVARSYAQIAHLAPPETIYVDANSIGPETARSIGNLVSEGGCDFVDGAINGLARTLSTGGTFFLSGPRADDVAAALSSIVRVRVLGPEIGRASTMKMLLGGLTKGMCALFLELATLAEQRQMLPEMMEACTMIYPGITTVIERMLPTYASHARRRAAEMRELEQTVQNSGIEPGVIASVRELHERLASLSFASSDGANVAAFVDRAISSFLVVAAPDPVRDNVA